MQIVPKPTPFPWFDNKAEGAARSYAFVFNDSRAERINRPGTY